MKLVTKVAAKDGKTKVEVIVKTVEDGAAWASKDVKKAHNFRVDRVVEAVAEKFHYADIKLS